MTLLLGVTSIGAFVVIFSQFFKTDTPVVTTSLEFGSQIQRYNLYEQGVVVPFSMSYRGQFILSDLSKYVTIQVQVGTFIFNPQTGGFDADTPHTFDYAPCNQTNDPKAIEAIKISTSGEGFERIVNVNFCPVFSNKEEEMYLLADSVKSSYRGVGIWVYPCSLPDQSHCAKKEEINGITLRPIMNKKLLVSSDKKNPLRLLHQKQEIKLDTLNTKYRVYEVREHRVVDEVSQFVSPKMKVQFDNTVLASTDTASRDPSTIYCSPQLIKMGRYGPCREYVHFDFSGTGEVMIMRRSYKGLTVIMGEFGGVIKILTSVVFFFYSVYSSRKMTGYFTSNLFSTTKKDEEELKKLLKRVDDKKLGEKNEAKKVGTDHEPSSAFRFRGRSPKTLISKKIKVKEAMKECFISRSRAVDMMEKLNVVSLIEKFMFKEHDKVLLPLVVLNLKQKELQEQQRKKERAAKLRKRKNMKNGGYAKPHQVATVFDQAAHQNDEEEASRQAKHLPQQTKSSGSDEFEKNGKESAYERAYSELLNYQPEGEMQMAIRDFMFENVKEFFDLPSTDLNNKKVGKKDPNFHSKSRQENKKFLVKTSKFGEATHKNNNKSEEGNEESPIKITFHNMGTEDDSSANNSVSTSLIQRRNGNAMKEPLRLSILKKQQHPRSRHLIKSPMMKRLRVFIKRWVTQGLRGV